MWSAGSYAKKNLIRPYEQEVYAQLRIHPENEMHRIRWDFEIQMDHLISARRPDQVIVNKKKKREPT